MFCIRPRRPYADIGSVLEIARADDVRTSAVAPGRKWPCREDRLRSAKFGYGDDNAATQPIYCTMKGYRALELGGSASLSAVCHHIKLARAGDLHGAIEDA